MTLDEAIKICEEDAEKIGGNPQSERHAERCKKIAEWLSELKELRNSVGAVKLELLKEAQAELEKRGNMLYDAIAELEEAKRLLKDTTSDIHDMLTERFGVICEFCKWYDSKNADCAKPRNGSGAWCCEYGCSRYADEVKELIGETNDEP